MTPNTFIHNYFIQFITLFIQRHCNKRLHVHMTQEQEQEEEQEQKHHIIVYSVKHYILTGVISLLGHGESDIFI